jgi:hypothetical protein
MIAPGLQSTSTNHGFYSTNVMTAVLAMAIYFTPFVNLIYSLSLNADIYKGVSCRTSTLVSSASQAALVVSIQHWHA